MKLRLFITIFISLIFGSFSAKTADSSEIYIHRLTDKSLSISQRIKTYIKLHHLLELKDSKSAQSYLEKGYELAKKVNSYYGKAWYFKINAYTSLTRGEIQKGIYQSNTAAHYFLKNKDTLNYLESKYQAAYGLIVSSKNSEAKKLLETALSLIDSNHYYKQQGMFFSLLSHIESDHNLLQAFSYLNQSYNACLKVKNYAGMYSVFTDFSAFYENIEDYKLALAHSYKALFWVKKMKPVNDFDLATVYQNIANCYIKLNQYKLALKYINLSAIYSKKIESEGQLLKGQLYKAICYYNLKEFKVATQLVQSILYDKLSTVEKLNINYLKMAIALEKKEFSKIPSTKLIADQLIKSEGLTEHSKMNYYSLCSNYYSQIHDISNAYKFFKKYHTIKVLQLERQKDFRLIRLQIKEMQRENTFAQNQLNFQKTKVKLLQETHQKERFYFVFGILLMFIVFSFIVWSIFIYRKRNIQLAQLNLLLSNLVDEKDILLKEVNHRVKNNFQLINSILSIQSRKNALSNTEFIKQFSERIYAMSFIHDHLFQASKLDEIDALPFLTELLEKTRLSSKSTELTIEHTISNSSIRMLLHELIPLGLIVNELVVNSYKHAFIGLNEGKIQLNIHQNSQWTEINYSDNGIGLPINFEKHTGFVIIEALLKKLNGTMEFTSDKGTHFKLCIPIYNQ